MLQIPLSVAAISIRPRGESAQVYRIAAATAPRRYFPGSIPNSDAVREYRRLVELYPASCMARVTDCPDRKRCRNPRMRHEFAYSFGVIPSTDLNMRCKWKGLCWNSDPSCPSVSGSSKCCSMYRHTAFTTCCRGFPFSAFGRQRMHSRKPADSASCGRGKNVTFSRRGRRDGHDGRQYTPVEDTANTNLPSLSPSRSTTDCQRASSGLIVIATCLISTCLDLSAETFSLAVFMKAAYDPIGDCAIRILRSK